MSAGLWFSGDTAIAWTCRELIKGRTISHADEIAEVGAWRLGAIIHVLRTRYKWPITTERRGVERIAYYRLGRSAEPLKLPKSAREGDAANAAKDTESKQATTQEQGGNHAEA
ncbi:hypothetical protein [Acidithiobacillus marinus]|uniref:hypothetical protein n=1 Tax=Acidithiobacillus marinus TaxID=187490 RepID=UPI000C756DAB|nr:hypothetical protein [Acidithiobacillus marinus]